MHYRGRSPIILFANLIADMLAVVAAYYSAIGFRFHSHIGNRLVEFLNWALRVPRFETAADGLSFEAFYLMSAPRIIALITLTVVLIYVGMDLYPGRRLLARGWRRGDIARANLYALLFFFVYFYLSRNQFHPRSMFATIMAFNTVYTVTFRALAAHTLRGLRRRTGVDRCRALVCGDGEAMPPLAQWIDETKPHGVYPVERVLVGPSHVGTDDLDRIRRRIATHDADMLILAAPRLPMNSLMRFMELSDGCGIPLKILSPELDVLGVRTGLRSDRIGGMSFVHFAPTPVSHGYTNFKRAYSFILSATALLLLSPLMLLLGVAVRCNSRGAARFVQERIGLNRQPFRMYKFRTMFQDAEQRQSQVETFNESGRGLFKMRRDPRVTPVGRFLRRYSLDELPQLINVLRGDMTLVGPRPLPRRDLEQYYEEWHYMRHKGLPGLTCLWQVVGRSDLDFHSMCLLDIYYLRNQTLGLDFRILARTIQAVVFARGAY